MAFTKGHKLNIGNKYAFKHGLDKHRKTEQNSSEKICIECNGVFRAFNYRLERTKFCSKKCQGIVVHRINLKGRKNTPEQMKIIAKAHTGNTYRLGLLRPDITGVNHPNWIVDRSKLKTYSGSEERRSQYYKEWRKQVWLRDKFTCRIADNNCDGRIEAHHILGFAEYPELRYQINNGITLCHAHHPRARAEEKRLIPTFMELVSVSSN